MSFHVNPKTGNSGICKANNGRCPFGSAEDHFETREEAQAAFEKKMEKFEQFHWKTKVPATKGAYTLAVYDPMSEEVPLGGLWGNTVYGKFLEKLEAADDEARLVVENGEVWKKNKLYGDSSWKITQKGWDNNTQFELGRSYDIAWVARAIQTHGARLEQGGSDPKIALDHLRDVYPSNAHLNDEVSAIKEVFNEEASAPDPQTLSEHLDDHIADRWSGLTPGHWMSIRQQLEEKLGSPKNVGSNAYPRWIWSH